MTADEARALALALPGAEESSHFDTPDFRVRGKIFATLPGPDRMVVRIDPPDQAVLLAAEPATFSPCPGAWGLKGWTIVQLGRWTRTSCTTCWWTVLARRLRP